ncbi:MAG: hypothetical protein ACI9EF_000383, partial [Pseudohongiellaceae bacterium]
MMSSPTTLSEFHVPQRRSPAPGVAESLLRGSRLALLSVGLVVWAGPATVLAAAVTAAGASLAESVAGHGAVAAGEVGGGAPPPAPEGGG